MYWLKDFTFDTPINPSRVNKIELAAVASNNENGLKFKPFALIAIPKQIGNDRRVKEIAFDQI